MTNEKKETTEITFCNSKNEKLFIIYVNDYLYDIFEMIEDFYNDQSIHVMSLNGCKIDHSDQDTFKSTQRIYFFSKQFLSDKIIKIK